LLAFTVMVSQFYQYDYHSNIQKTTKDINNTLTLGLPLKKNHIRRSVPIVRMPFRWQPLLAWGSKPGESDRLH